MTLKQSYFVEIKEIERALEDERLATARMRGLRQHFLRRRDSSDFMGSDPNDRMQYAKESGLFPK